MQKLKKLIFFYVKIILTIINIILFISQLKKKNLFLKIHYSNKNKKTDNKLNIAIDKLKKELWNQLEKHMMNPISLLYKTN